MAVRENAPLFTTLPRAFYLDDRELFEAEFERIWSREWLYIAHESEIPAVGDFVVRQVVGESVVIVRKPDGGISAVLNVCRHRGARIVDAPSGCAKRFTCPYHQWTYELDGTLRGAPSMPDSESVKYDELGLYRVHVEVWCGLVFICLGEDAPSSVGAAIDELSPALRAYGPETMRKVAMKTYECNANWKVMLENYLECYHCSGSHPEFCVTADLRIRSDSDYVDEAYREHPYWGLDIPLRRDTKTASITGDYVSAPLLVDEANDIATGHSRGFVIQPAFTVLYFYADYAMVHEIRPVSPTETHFHLHWFVSGTASPEGLDMDALTHVWDMTTRQDVALIERTQDGLKSRRYAPGPLSARQEPGIRAALNTYREIMRGDEVVERLKVGAI
jgi:phenylpropionate dioxygenase-like ring-hydroxylating dioxygenase large terminal subunit